MYIFEWDDKYFVRIDAKVRMPAIDKHTHKRRKVITHKREHDFTWFGVSLRPRAGTINPLSFKRKYYNIFPTTWASQLSSFLSFFTLTLAKTQNKAIRKESIKILKERISSNRAKINKSPPQQDLQTIIFKQREQIMLPPDVPVGATHPNVPKHAEC